MARRPYTTSAVLVQGEPPVKIKWFPVPRENGTLPFPTRINSLDWHTDPHRHEGVGEVYGTPRSFNRARERRVLGDHVCGTADDFRNGQKPNDTRPATVYLPSGIPVCCDPAAREAVGGVGVGVNALSLAGVPVMAHAETGVQAVSLVFADVAIFRAPAVGVQAVAGLLPNVPQFAAPAVGVQAVAGLLPNVPQFAAPAVGVQAVAGLLPDLPQFVQAGAGVGCQAQLIADFPLAPTGGVGVGRTSMTLLVNGDIISSGED